MTRTKAVVAEGTLLQENPAGSKGVNQSSRRSQGIRKVLEHVEADGRVEYFFRLRNLGSGCNESCI
jgi:hypothetical protein